MTTIYDPKREVWRSRVLLGEVQAALLRFRETLDPERDSGVIRDLDSATGQVAEAFQSTGRVLSHFWGTMGDMT